MQSSDLVVSYPEFFVSELHKDSLWLKLSGNFFHNFLSFDHRDFLHDYFVRLAADRQIKTVVLYSAFKESGSDEYLRFFLFECPELPLGHLGFSNTMQRYELHRFCNMIDQTVLDIVALDKVVVHICTGDVLSVFMNISLACDYRIVTSETVFHNVFQEIGMLPKGGAPFFLSHTIGTARTKNLLLQERITSRDALDNGIADCVVPPGDLESTAMEAVRRYSQISDQTLFGVKRLANYNLKGLKAYLEFETEQILKLGHREQFSDQ